jgi:hypothetical protein
MPADQAPDAYELRKSGLARPFLLTATPASADEHGQHGQMFVADLNVLNNSGVTITGRVMVNATRFM